MSANNLTQQEIEEMMKRLQAEKMSPDPAGSGEGSEELTIAGVEFPELTPHKPKGKKQRELDFFRAVPVKLSLELGRATLTVREILQLGENSVIKLNSAAGDDAVLCVNDKPLAFAEVVVINENIGCRVVDFKMRNRYVED
ncbi:MAG: FliM/FliN family flagellar motor switch protein [Firmicutes bacterium]|nr:FliM/FliN family flagellar motor switch protein [Bacillota bacterium]